MKIKFALALPLFFLSATLSSSSTFLFTGNSSGVMYSVNNPDGGTDYPDYLSSNPIGGSFASAGTYSYGYWGSKGFHLSATDPSYSDAGIVLFYNGGLTLGQLDTVSVTTTNHGAMNINLWLDTNGDGKFFNVDSNGRLTANGDSWAGANSTSLNANSYLDALGGIATGTHTLQELQHGAIPGIGPNTRAALWIGIINNNNADITSISVTATPEPASMLLLGCGLVGIAIVCKRKRV